MAKESVKRLHKGTRCQILLLQLATMTPKPRPLASHGDPKSIFLGSTWEAGCESGSDMSLQGTRTSGSGYTCAKPDLCALCASA